MSFPLSLSGRGFFVLWRVRFAYPPYTNLYLFCRVGKRSAPADIPRSSAANQIKYLYIFIEYKFT